MDIPDDDVFPFVPDEEPSVSPHEPLRTKYDRAVVFVDVLGFAALTEQYPIDAYVFQQLQRPGNIEFLRASLEGLEANLLAEQFIRFHLLVEECAKDSRLVEDSAVVIFSDCAFFAAETLGYAISFAVHVMQSAIEHRVPVRIGVAHGTFIVVRARSDFGMANQDHVVQFLGAGVTRAHAAERCGVKGMRILLHPSAHALFNASEHLTMVHSLTGEASEYRHPIPLPENEASNRANVSFEINYLTYPMTDIMVFQRVAEMRQASPPYVGIHYEATHAALQRMRRALEREPFTG